LTATTRVTAKAGTNIRIGAAAEFFEASRGDRLARRRGGKGQAGLSFEEGARVAARGRDEVALRDPPAGALRVITRAKTVVPSVFTSRATTTDGLRSAGSRATDHRVALQGRGQSPHRWTSANYCSHGDPAGADSRRDARSGSLSAVGSQPSDFGRRSDILIVAPLQRKESLIAVCVTVR